MLLAPQPAEVGCWCGGMRKAHSCWVPNCVPILRWGQAEKCGVHSSAYAWPLLLLWLPRRLAARAAQLSTTSTAAAAAGPTHCAWRSSWRCAPSCRWVLFCCYHHWLGASRSPLRAPLPCTASLGAVPLYGTSCVMPAMLARAPAAGRGTDVPRLRRAAHRPHLPRLQPVCVRCQQRAVRSD